LIQSVPSGSTYRGTSVVRSKIPAMKPVTSATATCSVGDRSVNGKCPSP
jgi:hypothetical protein